VSHLVKYEGKTYTKISPQDIDKAQNEYLDTKVKTNMQRQRYKAFLDGLFTANLNEEE
jgi:hypothetical protein